MYNSLELRVRKWGNSLGIRIPKKIAEIMKIQDGTDVILTFRKDHVELRVSNGSGRNGNAPVSPAKPQRIIPDYSRNPGLKRTPLTLTDANFEENLKQYPFLIVLFIDYMYMDFYDRIEERLLQLRWMARYYSGLVWFGIARMSDNELSRDRYVGDVWGEEEVRGFVNGKLVFRAKKLRDVEDVISRLLPSEKQKVLSGRSRFSQPVLATQGNINSLLSGHPVVVMGFLAPGDSEGIRLFDRLAAHYKGKVLFAIAIDRAFFNEKSRTFYRNPLFERFEVKRAPEVILFQRGMRAGRCLPLDRDTLTREIDALLKEEVSS